jgi:hypothetical protein
MVSDAGILPKDGDLVWILDLWTNKTVGTFIDHHAQLNITIP